MQKSLFNRNYFRYYLIPILLLIGSFSLYSYNLGNQPWHGDELDYLGWGGPYFELIKEGDFDNPCLRGLTDCELIYDPDWPGHHVNYSPVRNFLVGFGYYLATGDTKGDFYEWSCMWFPCWNSANTPSSEEFAAGRFFSPIFGSLTVVLAFFIGKILFNRITGLSFSLILLFYSLWLVNSRLIMTEVYLYFFILLSILLLLKSFKKESKHRKLFFISGAISFGIALNIKLVAIEFVIPIFLVILFYDSFNEKLNFRFFKNRKNVLKVSSLVLGFFVISSISFFASYPKYYDDPINEILKTRSYAEGMGYVSLPTSEKNYLYKTLTTLQVTLFPYLTDSYIHEVFLEEARQTRLSTDTPSNYSSIPLTLFFFLGLGYLIKKIKDKNLSFSELALLVWFSSLFIFAVLIVDMPTQERYYLPLMFSIILIASYALGNFIKQIQSQKEKILFFMSFMVAQSLYIVLYFDKIYFSNEFWRNPLPISSELSLNDPLVYVSSITFVMIFILIYLRTRVQSPSQTRKDTARHETNFKSDSPQKTNESYDLM